MNLPLLRLLLLAGLSMFTMPAKAQAWIGELAARIGAEKREMRDTSNCFAGIPQPEAKQAEILAGSEQALTAYFALTSAADPKTLSKVLTTSAKDSYWRKGGDIRNFLSLGAELDAPTPSLTRSAFVVSGDGQSARGIWRPTGGAGPIYIIDFFDAPTMPFSGAWHIWRMAIMPDSAEADQLIFPYCKMNSDVPENLLSVLYTPEGQPMRPAAR